MLSTIRSPAPILPMTKSQQLANKKRKRINLCHSVMETWDGISPERKHTKLQSPRSVSTIVTPASILSKKKPQQLANKKRKRVKFHHSAKTWDGIWISPERKPKQLHMKTQLERLFSDFWSKECKLSVLTELVAQRNSTVLASLCGHILGLMQRLEQCPTEIFVPLLENGGEKQIALTKAHLYHVKQLFLYVSCAHNQCVRICTANAAQGDKLTV